MSSAVKKVGTSGQISLGKEYSGRSVLVEEVESGVWMVKLGEFVPDNERWLWDPAVQESLDSSLKWVEENPRQESDLEALEKRILGTDE